MTSPAEWFDRQTYWSEWRPLDEPTPIQRSFQPGLAGWVTAMLHGWLRKSETGEWYADVTAGEYGGQHIQLPGDLVRPMPGDLR